MEGLVEPLQPPRRLARAGTAIVDHAQGAHVRADWRLVAAPTTSLPEAPGGVRNWDYRYCWLRDAVFTIAALHEGGYQEEALAWRQWLLRAVAGEPEAMQIVYGPAGERRLTELQANWLPGYEGARPVRIGNAAAEQFSTSTARSPTPSSGSRATSAFTRRSAASRGGCSSSWSRRGASPTRGFGRCAVGGATSPTPR